METPIFPHPGIASSFLAACRRLFPAFLLGTALSCSIWEERGSCPCLLRFDLTKDCGLSSGAALALSLYDEAGSVVLDEKGLILSDLLAANSPDVEVPKGDIRAGGTIGLRTAERSLDGDYIRIPAGLPADSLYFLSGRADASGEKAVIPVRLRKDFSCIEITFALTEGPGVPPECPYFLYIRSYTAGLDLRDGTPLPGRFHCYPEECGTGVFRSVLPRQRTPEDLVLEVRSKEGAHDLIDEIPLNSYLPSGFSWQDEDLKDIRVRIDYVHARLEVCISDWESGEVYHYTI